MDLLYANDRPGEFPRSHYAETADIAAPRPAATGEIKTDICIIGAGFTGLSAALHLARRGYRVAVLEAQRAGFGASGRNGGQVGTGQRRDQDWLEKTVGETRARALWDMSLGAVELVRALCTELAEPFHPGIIHAEHGPGDVAASHDYADKLVRNYHYGGIAPLSRAELRDLVATDAYFGGTLDTTAGHIHPLRFALGLARLAEAAGAVIFENSRVSGYSAGPACTVHTERAVVTADHLILACNGYLGQLNSKVAARVMPINNFVVATEPMTAAEQERLIAGNHAVADSKFVVNYYRFSEDHRLLFGGSESYGYRFPRDIAAAVRKPMLRIFPQLDGTRITHNWGGTLAITMNRMPHFARLAGNVLSLSGYSGHGVAMATMGGQIAAQAIAGQAERFDLMASVPTHRFPGGAALRWPLLVAAMFWYSLRDRL